MRSAIVTGGAGGIGSAVCRRLAADGYAVAVGYNKSEQEALTLCEELRKSGTAMVLQLDLTDPASLLAAYRRFRAELGVPEVLVNNGGAAHIGIFTDMSDSEILNLLLKEYKDLFGEDGIVQVDHAGLECSVILGKYPHLDVVSLGPTIRSPHTTTERALYATAVPFWELLKKTMEDVPVK